MAAAQSTVPDRLPLPTAVDAVARASLAAAHGHLAAGRVREAAEAYRRALETNRDADAEPERAVRVSALLGLTLIARRTGQVAAALRLAQAALELDPASVVGWASYGSLLHGLGQARDAQAAYLRSLALPAGQAAAFLPALNGLGELMLGARRAQAASACFRRALGIAPTSVVALHGLGTALALMERFPQALECFQAVLAARPEQVEARFAAGYCAAKLSRHTEAIAHYEQAIRLRPGFAAAWGNMAVCLVADGRDYLAVPCFAQALEADPRLVSALLNFGNLLRLRKAWPQARECYERALAVDAGCTDVLIAMSYLELEESREPGRFLHAEGWLDRAAANGGAEHPEVANAWGILALARQTASGSADDLDAAIAAFGRAAALGHRTADSNAGNALLRVGRVEDAMAAHGRSVALDPLHAGARYNLALSQLRAGRYAEGWRNYEARLDFREVHPRPRRFQQPRWHGALADGSDGGSGFPEVDGNEKQIPCGNDNKRDNCKSRFPAGVTDKSRFPSGMTTKGGLAARDGIARDGGLRGVRVFVYYEQGLGDTLQFARYLPLLAAEGARLIVEVQPPLVRLLRPFVASLGGECLASGKSIPGFDCHVPLLSLPGEFGTTLESIPPPIVLRPEPVDDEPVDMDARFPGWAAGELSIGLCWAGNPRYAADRDRSTRLETFLPLLREFPRHRWVSLQKGEAAEQIAPARALLPAGFPLFDGGSRNRDLAETATVMAALDLVVTTDTVMAHLAAALGRPCWLLLPWQSDWRWMQRMPTTPWYPGMRLFRQRAAGDWPGVMGSVSGELRALRKHVCSRGD